MTGKRAQKKAETREALTQAAWQLFAERGFDAVTVADICAEVDVARRTWFRYFPAKESVVFEGHRARLARFLDLLEACPPDEDVWATLRRLCHTFAADYTADRAAILRTQRLIQSSPVLLARERELGREWEAGLEAFLRARSDGAAHWARLVAGASMGLVIATLRDWTANDGRTDLARMGDEAITCLKAGFSLLRR